MKVAELQYRLFVLYTFNLRLITQTASGKTTKQSLIHILNNHLNIVESSHYSLMTPQGQEPWTETEPKQLFCLCCEIKFMQTCLLLFSVTHSFPDKQCFCCWQAVFEELQAEVAWLSTLICLHVCLISTSNSAPSATQQTILIAQTCLLCIVRVCVCDEGQKK